MKRVVISEKLKNDQYNYSLFLTDTVQQSVDGAGRLETLGFDMPLIKPRQPRACSVTI